MARGPWRWILPAAFGVLGVAAFAGAAVAARRPSAAAGPKPRRPKEISPKIYALADKWATRRGVPLQWVLSTILVESNGRPNQEGDCYTRDDRGRRVRRPACLSVGLMQVNWKAHGKRLQDLGIAQRREDLYDPDINIEAGTLILREVWDAIAREVGGGTAPAPLDVLVRFGYKGLSLLRRALREGIHPRDKFEDGETVVARWSRALAQTTAVV